MIRISVKNLTKIYNKPRCKFLRGLFSSKPSTAALSDVSFEIKSGECVGIIGVNGSGKSTLLKLLCGVTAQSSGSIFTDGKISSLLELGCGFNSEYNGISNIYLNETVMGYTRAQIKAMLPEIIAFADIGDYIKKPVKTYSDGMFLRLAFACAVAARPDILIVDEALAVGDFAFRQKCFSKINEMKNSGTTVLMVSHDIDTIRRFCERTMWLDGGVLKMDGSTAEVSAAYMEYVTGSVDNVLHKSVLDASGFDCINRFGAAVGTIISAEIPKTQRHGQTVKIIIDIDIPHDARLDTLAVSAAIKNGFGLDLQVLSTADNGIRFTSHGRHRVTISYPCLLCGGEYSLCLSLEDRSTAPIKYYDYIEGAVVFEVVSETPMLGLFSGGADFEVE